MIERSVVRDHIEALRNRLDDLEEAFAADMSVQATIDSQAVSTTAGELYRAVRAWRDRTHNEGAE